MYCARPSRRSPWPGRDGRGTRELKTAWHDGTRELVFEPLEFLERLRAMTRRSPRTPEGSGPQGMSQDTVH
jgi:hypothetical protein